MAPPPRLRQALEPLVLPIWHANLIFSALFTASLAYLMRRYVTEILAIFCLVSSLFYLLRFFANRVRAVMRLLQPLEKKKSVPSTDEDDFLVGSSAAPVPAPVPCRLLGSTDAVSEKTPEDVQSIVSSIDEVDDFLVGSSAAQALAQVPCRLLGRADAVSEQTPEEAEEIVASFVSGEIPSYVLETKLGDCRRAAGLRHEAVRRITGRQIEGFPLDGFDYASIVGQCCGYVQLPVNIAGPLLIDGQRFYVPMATTEGCLVACTNRGCKAIAESGGATSVVLRDAMTRTPVARFPTARRTAELKYFLEDPANFDTVSLVFNRSSRFARMRGVQCAMAGRNIYMKFSCSTGDATGMKMISKGVQNVLDYLQDDFPDMDVTSISGNFSSDMKPADVNWIDGCGKSVVCEAVIKEEIVRKVLKTNVQSLVELNVTKNIAGSAVAGAPAQNAHAINIVTAIFIATGQDPAQNVESSQCITMFEAVNDGKDLHISVTMPSIEVGTIGGGTQLASQSACLKLLGVRGAHRESPGANARLLATVVAGGVLAGELSLLSALAAGQLIKSHMKYNRSSRDMSRAASLSS